MTDDEAVKDLDELALQFYTHELWYLTLSVKKRCEKIFEATPPPDSPYYIKMEPAILTDIFGVLSQAAGIRKLLYTYNQKQKNESSRAFKLRKYRAHYLSEMLKPLELDEILNAKVRNTIEHFDEYLDEAVIKLSNPKTRPSPVVASNLVLSDWSAINPRVFPIRVYIVADKTFHNMNWFINLGKIHDEAGKIVEFLHANTEGQLSKDKEFFGMLVKF